jgi:hypothetical protein
MMKLLNLDDAEENLLHWLVQCCLSDKLLLKSGIPPDLHEQYLAPVRTLDAKLKEIWARERPGSVPACGEPVGEVPGVGVIYCTRPAGHPPGSGGKPGHFGEIRQAE